MKTQEEVQAGKRLSWDETKSVIEGLPQSWIPDILRRVVEASVYKKVFRDGGAARFVDEWEKKAIERRDQK